MRKDGGERRISKIPYKRTSSTVGFNGRRRATIQLTDRSVFFLCCWQKNVVVVVIVAVVNIVE